MSKSSDYTPSASPAASKTPLSKGAASKGKGEASTGKGDASTNKATSPFFNKLSSNKPTSAKRGRPSHAPTSDEDDDEDFDESPSKKQMLRRQLAAREVKRSASVIDLEAEAVVKTEPGEDEGFEGEYV